MVDALQHPDRVSSLIVVDIAPVKYRKELSAEPNEHQQIVRSVLDHCRLRTTRS